MLDPDRPEYFITLSAAWQYLGMVPIIPYIPLPRAVFGLDPALWVDPRDWATRDPDTISHSVFARVGDRPPAIPPGLLDDVSPTRGLFATGRHAIRYGDVAWPGGVEPLLFICVRSHQRVSHYHVAVVFHYYSKNVASLQRALHWDGMTCSRIKSSWTQTVRYLQLQARQICEYRVREPAATRFKDYLRLADLAAIVAVENESLGFAGLFDGRTPRRYYYWARPPANPGLVGMPAIAHVAHQEWYFSNITHVCDNGYMSQAVCAIYPFAPDGRGPYSRFPRSATFCTYGTLAQVRWVARLH